MDEAKLALEPDTEGTDLSAIEMMLSYVAAECRRLGSEEAARHASMAATLLRGSRIRCGADRVVRGEDMRIASLH